MLRFCFYFSLKSLALYALRKCECCGHSNDFNNYNNNILCDDIPVTKKSSFLDWKRWRKYLQDKLHVHEH